MCVHLTRREEPWRYLVTGQHSTLFTVFTFPQNTDLCGNSSHARTQTPSRTKVSNYPHSSKHLYPSSDCCPTHLYSNPSLTNLYKHVDVRSQLQYTTLLRIIVRPRVDQSLIYLYSDTVSTRTHLYQRVEVRVHLTSIHNS